MSASHKPPYILKGQALVVVDDWTKSRFDKPEGEMFPAHGPLTLDEALECMEQSERTVQALRVHMTHGRIDITKPVADITEDLAQEYVARMEADEDGPQWVADSDAYADRPLSQYAMHSMALEHQWEMEAGR